jgi:hypothetical protein
VYDTPRGLPIWNLTRFNLSLLGGLITCSKRGARHTPPAVVCNLMKTSHMNTLLNISEILEKSKYPSELFEKYFEYQKQFLESELLRINNELNKKTKELDIELQIELINLYNESYLNFLEGTFPDIQNKTSLVLLFSTFEQNLKNTCKILGEELKTPIDYSDLNGDDLLKCKKFLIKFCGVNETIFNNENWKRIDFIRRIRNSIIHNNSEISSLIKKEKKIIEEFQKNYGFSIVSEHITIVKPNFLISFLKTIDLFQLELFEEIKKSQKLLEN